MSLFISLTRQSFNWWGKGRLRIFQNTVLKRKFIIRALQQMLLWRSNKVFIYDIEALTITNWEKKKFSRKN
jgi:hypothetical protein